MIRKRTDGHDAENVTDSSSQELWYTLSPILTRKSKRTCKRSSSPILKSIQQLQAGTGSCIDIFNESQKETSPVIDVNSSPKQCGSSSPVFRSKSLKPRSLFVIEENDSSDSDSKSWPTARSSRDIFNEKCTDESFFIVEVDDHAQQELENKLDKTETMITGELFSQESKDKEADEQAHDVISQVASETQSSTMCSLPLNIPSLNHPPGINAVQDQVQHQSETETELCSDDITQVASQPQSMAMFSTPFNVSSNRRRRLEAHDHVELQLEVESGQDLISHVASQPLSLTTPSTPLNDASCFLLRLEKKICTHDSTRKKNQHLVLNGSAQRLKRLISRQGSDYRLWRHQTRTGKEPPLQNQQILCIQVLACGTDSQHHLSVQCKVLSGPLPVETVIILLNKERWDLRISCEQILNVHPPWKSYQTTAGTVLLGINFMQQAAVVAAESTSSLDYPEVSAKAKTQKILRKWICPCTSDDSWPDPTTCPAQTELWGLRRLIL